ncbi:multisubunit potassium/proton antiporter, PhaA subunit /multisubunit potassium/proton antiporter, PhaB subunit [Ectothiorhodospira mobilis]|uniref:Multisubunit potassium/proton antiporter, PhaA subunit /multisubunit potassium/proton antiporter, PhaB subunit n=1 Tax=Ectothiorhodospira mobilis TaxID=195064 RepID=A0A1I4PZ76_ECTMO|nr:monovalent cation/H+ antiporter subunit A [Ectothiorhodospira mobilis]SFM33089.1 multisubunit potassium/proton antiporter, PhaA subunit /multisubunit potassium/proton antiporter, PhaB subunit [Ectothiorhodospira mobilis]
MSLALIVLLPFLGALLPGLLIRSGRNACATATASVTVLALALLLVHTPAVLRGEVVQAGWDWLPGLGLNANFFLDGLGLLFAGLILGIGLLIIIYARFYLSEKDPMGLFYTYLLLFQGAMVGVVLSDNILLLLVFWELTSLSSFLLIGYWRHLPAGRQGARMALVVTGGGGLAMIAGMLLLGQMAGSYDLSVILERGEQIQASPLYLPTLLLILVGCFTKSAQFPFHFWLPHAMAAPTPVSAYLHSATMVKAGIFLLARLWPVLAGTDVWFYLVATTGLFTMVLAAGIALFKDDLKGLLAYSTVSHLGLVTFLFGLGSPMAAAAGVFHIINHATFKAALFMSAGIVDHETGTRHIPRLGGLMHLMPVTATLAMVAAASMAGIPPFNGFISKEMMLEQAAHTPWAGLPWLVPAAATLGAVFSVAYALRYAVHVFWGPPRADYPRRPHDPAAGFWLPPAVLVALVVIIGLFPEQTAGPLVRAAADAVTGGALPDLHLYLWHGLTPALGMSVVALLGGAALLWRYGDAWARWRAGPHPEAKTMYDAAMARLVAASQYIIHTLHNGALQRYLAVMLASAVVLGYAAFSGAAHLPGTRETLEIFPVAGVLWLLMAGGCWLAVAHHRQRLLAVVAVSVVGLMVSIGFLYLSAPDLALTQISVEVVTTVLMLLALYFLPKRTPEESSGARRVRDGVLAVLAGVGVGGLCWAVLTRDFSTISGYYLDQAVPGGGGANVVNVILVDFRGFDTFGEIIVLGIAALAIYALLEGALRGPAAAHLAAWKGDMPRAADRHPIMMVVATRVMLPLALLVGVYILLRGHNMPGGGFIAGLVVSIALIMQYMASGFQWAARRMAVDYDALIGLGVLVAGATGVAAMVGGYPFLTSAHDYVHLPWVGEVELASAMVFDVGVFLTVVGAVMLALAQVSRLGLVASHEPANEGPMDFDPSTPARTARRDPS